ncbi:hypothetical protein PO909_007464, partial [Leuciscus waleckii]
KTFLAHSNFTEQQKTHSGEKAYKCSHCGESVSRSKPLKGHERGHTAEKPPQCSSCGKSFTHWPNLLVHMKKHCPNLCE